MSSYKIILKTTGLFASLRVVTILVNIITSKLIAVFLGVSGIGTYGIYMSTLTLITTVSDLGVSKSSIRNIAKADGLGDKKEVGRTISIVSRLIYITGGFGGIITALLSFQISKWSLGTGSYWVSFVLLGICVFFTIVKNGQFAILQGLRKYRLIMVTTIYTSLLSLVVSLPLIYFFRENSIVYLILSGSIIGFVLTKRNLGKIQYDLPEDRVKLTKRNSAAIVKLGLAMMLVSFLVALSEYIIRAFIGNYGTLEDLGYFQAGFQIISGYFGLIFTSMTTDYFPRISAIQNDNEKLAREVNQQAIITLLLICPLIVVLPFLMPYVIKLLYTNGFEETINYVNIALFGIIFQTGSQTMGMILLAKNDTKAYLIYIFSLQFIGLCVNIVGYRYFGLFGLGVAFSVNMLLQLLSILVINRKMYSIFFDLNYYKVFIVVFSFALLSYLFRHLSGMSFYLFFVFNLALSVLFVVVSLKKVLEITSLVETIKLRFIKN